MRCLILGQQRSSPWRICALRYNDWGLARERLHLVAHVSCRVADVPARKVLFGRHIIVDLAQPHGEVLLDCLA